MKFFSKLFGIKNNASKSVAKERLQLVLIHDRTDISPEMMELLRNDLIAVITSYMDVDDKNIELDLDREDNAVALVANIPILRLKRSTQTKN